MYGADEWRWQVHNPDGYRIQYLVDNIGNQKHQQHRPQRDISSSSNPDHMPDDQHHLHYHFQNGSSSFTSSSGAMYNDQLNGYTDFTYTNGYEGHH